MEENTSEFDTLIQTKLDGDTEFQATLADLSDEDKETKIAEKKAELVKQTAIEQLEARKKADEVAKNQKLRAEKAEKEAKEKGGSAPTEKKDEKELSSMDMLAVLKANVNDDDLPEVIDYAKLKGITVAEALKAPLVIGILAEKEEKRKTADATHTGSGNVRKTTQNTDKSLIENASKGELPDSEEEIQKLWRLKHGIK